MEEGTGSATHPTTGVDAGSKLAVDKKNQMVAHQLLLPVSMAKKMKITIHLPFPVVQLVSAWALLMALLVPFSVAVGYALISSQSALLLRLPETTETQDAQLSEILGGRLLCTAVQAAAAALALWLPCHHGRRRIRRDFATVALIANHCMVATALLVVLPAFPALGDDLLFRIFPSAGVFLCLVIDLLGFLALVFIGSEEVMTDEGVLLLVGQLPSELELDPCMSRIDRVI